MTPSRRTIHLHDEIADVGSAWRRSVVHTTATRALLATASVDEVTIIGQRDVVFAVLGELERRDTRDVVMHALFERYGLWRAVLRRATATAETQR